MDEDEELTQSGFQRRMDLNQRQRALNAEIVSVDNDILKLQELKRTLNTELRDVTRELEDLAQRRVIGATTADLHGISRLPKGKTGKGLESNPMRRGEAATVDYFAQFDWSGELKRRMKRIFGFDQFRLCQEGICNASMDGRDCVAVMPTGGGKSLTYQLPALLCSGTTLVISPLIALITDQILHLHEAGIEACMLTGSASKEEQRTILQRLVQNPKANGRISAMDEEGKEIKLVYVTPEKIAKSKTFLSTLQKMANNGTFARIVIDEAHCVSQLGHDFRPDYQKLSILRQLFPHVPILALSATCPPNVLKDLLKILKMDAIVDGKSASAKGTVYFSSPLYRKNLHYKVLPKPASAPAVIQSIVDYIVANHKGHTGIVYCLSKKDAETVATGIQQVSGDQIRTGVYHADIGDGEKERLHKKWRSGEVKVVCATIAFGLGIDKGDVRFVIHHSMSKSLDGFYQESGRAGRDGKDSDCVLFFRGQDVTRLAALVCGEREGKSKLYNMLRFAQNLHECRKIQFAKYFSASSSLSLSAWSTEGSETLSNCEHCDNCTRKPDTIETKDVTLYSWRILKIINTISEEGGRATLGMLADLVRGAGGGVFDGSTGRGKGKGKAKEKKSLDLDQICGGKVEMTKDDVESLLITLLLQDYLKEEYSSTAYTINVYLVAGTQSLRLTRLSEEDVIGGNGHRIHGSFVKKEKGRKSTGTAKAKKTTNAGDFVPPVRKSRVSGSVSKDNEIDSDVSEPSGHGNWPVNNLSRGSREAMQTHAERMPRHRGSAEMPKRKRMDTSEEEGEGVDGDNDLADFIVDNDDDFEVPRDIQGQRDVPESDDDDDSWAFSFTGEANAAPRTGAIRSSKPATKRQRTSDVQHIDSSDIIELSD